MGNYWCPYKIGVFITGGERADRGRDCSDEAANQGPPRIHSHHQKLGRGKGGFYPESQTEHGPDDTLMSEVQPPEP